MATGICALTVIASLFGCSGAARTAHAVAGPFRPAGASTVVRTPSTVSPQIAVKPNLTISNSDYFQTTARQTPTIPAGLTELTAKLDTLNVGFGRSWDGYIETTTGSFTGVTGTFTVPEADQTAASDAATAIWVGVGGYNIPQLLQAGAGPVSPGPQMSAWVVDQNTDGSTPSLYEGIPIWIWIDAGDQVTVTLTRSSASQWQFTLLDDTDGQGYSMPVAFSGPAKSVEWITEDPGTNSGGLMPLLPFTTPVQWTYVAAAGTGTVSLGLAGIQQTDPTSYPIRSSLLSAGSFTQTYAPSSTLPTPTGTAFKNKCTVRHYSKRKIVRRGRRVYLVIYRWSVSSCHQVLVSAG